MTLSVRFSLVAALAVALIGGCALFETDEDRIVGSWEATSFGVTMTIGFAAQSDGASAVITYSDGSPGNIGDWSMDGVRLTIDWGGGDIAEFVYDFPDEDTLQLTPTDGVGLVLTMSRVS